MLTIDDSANNDLKDYIKEYPCIVKNKNNFLRDFGKQVGVSPERELHKGDLQEETLAKVIMVCNNPYNALTTFTGGNIAFF